MDGGCEAASIMRKPAVFCLLAFSSFLAQVAECNYDALWQYDRPRANRDFMVSSQDKTIDLPHPIIFHDHMYSALRVSKDGTVAFGADSGVSYDERPLWPRGFTEVSSSEDLPFIAPFHHKGYRPDNNPSTYTGRIYYEVFSAAATDDTGSDAREKRQFLDFLGTYLSHASVTVPGKFKPDVYVMITWENVTDGHMVMNNHSCAASVDSPCPSATFQLVLAANDTTTFAIFNYAKMDVPYTDSQLAGMNGGKRRGWTDVIYCDRTCVKRKQKREIMKKLPELQGSSSKDDSRENKMMDDVKGRFLFDVSGDVMVRGGCVVHLHRFGDMHTVEVIPRQVEMFGGQIIRFSGGPCQQPFQGVFCRFGEKAVTQGKMTAGMLGWCPVPRMTSRGRVKLEVSLDKTAWHFYTYVIVVPPDNTGHWSEDSDMQSWFLPNPSQLLVKWDPRQLSGTYDDVRVDIDLWQYKEQGDTAEWRKLTVLEQSYDNSGSYVFDPRSDIRFTCQEDCGDVALGLVDIKLSEEHKGSLQLREYVSIGPLPLAWYVNRVNTENTGEDWTRTWCERWAEDESRDSSWQEHLAACPCSLQQALADWGRFQVDRSCDKFTEESCRTSPRAKHCVRSVHPTAQSAASLCCYDNDNNLMYSGDSYHGSTSSRAHAWGAYPYDKAYAVPSMSHWLHDLVPYYHCCRWTNDELCRYYTDNRPTKSCRTYDPPGAAKVYGDPHVQTFDGKSYHFGGNGDFWLVQSTDLQIQARFLERTSKEASPVTPKDSLLMPTHISSVAIAGKASSDVVTFSLAPPDDFHHRGLDVQVFRRHFFFYTGLPPWQDFRGLSVINNIQSKRMTDRQQYNFTVLLQGGAGVQVAEENGLLNVVVLLPPHRKDGRSNQPPASRGLLGTWDGKQANEYMDPAGNTVAIMNSQDANDLYTYFSSKWVVKDNLLFRFNYSGGVGKPHFGSVLDYTDEDKRPEAGAVAALCGAEPPSRNPCAYDFYVTGNRTIAMATRRAQEDFENLRRSQRKIWSCGWLDIPFAIKDHTNYSAGNTLRVTGCRQGLGSSGSVDGGPTQYTCVQNATDHQPFWEPNKINRDLCFENTEGANIVMIIGIVAAVAVIIIVIMVVVAIVCYRRKKSQRKRPEEQPSYTQRDAKIDPGTDETLLKKHSPRVRMSEVRNAGEPV